MHAGTKLPDQGLPRWERQRALVDMSCVDISDPRRGKEILEGKK